MKRGGGDGRGEVETEDKRWADQFGLMCLRQSCAKVFFLTRHVVLPTYRASVWCF